jgi:thioredoxin reductase/NAD-dependent dihydropyrimidine dehydrogenase PreA subunit
MDWVLEFVSGHLSGVGIGIFGLFAFWQVSRKSKDTRQAKAVLQESIEKRMNEPFTLHPEIDPELCLGCGSCTAVCPEGDILKMVDHKAVLITPTSCVGHGECEQACPNHAISLVFGTKTRGMDIPRITSDYETNVPGLYIAGELGGMGLIRNAVKQGHLAASHALSSLGMAASSDTDLLIVGAGPAGLSAGLTAIEKKKSYICIEQNSFGGTVYNFPRQKVVMTHPADLPGVGKMKFPKNEVSKEELLEYWSQIRKKTGMKVREKVAFQGVERKGDVFEVKTSRGVITAKKVILAMGVRGSPRKLGLPNEDLPKVAYNLIDPEQYSGKDIAVVGGGNAGLEAAQALGNPALRNRVTILVRGPEFDRCNAENKRITLEMEGRRELKIRYSTSVREIHPDRILLKGPEKEEPLKNDYLFVFAGAEMPHQFLMSLGIQIDKKFGEALQKKR